MSTSTAEHDSYLVENWDTETLINFLKEQNLKLDDDDLGILRKEKITGQTFLGLTKEELQGIGLKLGPVKALLDEIKALKEKPKRAFSSYKSLSEVLAKYGIDSNGTDTIPLFSLQTHEIQDSNKHFKHCIDPGEISQASELPLAIEFNRKALDEDSEEYQTLRSGVKKVLEAIRITELEAKNTQLRQIIEENAKRDAENAEHKVRIEELEKNSADISAENTELKAELAKLRHDFDSSNLTRPQQPQHVTNVQNSCSVEEDISSAKPERRFASNDIPDLVIDQRVADNADIESMDTFLDETFKKSVSDGFRQRNREKKLLRESTTQDLSGVSNETTSSVIKDEKSQSHKKKEAENIVQDVFDFTATSAPEKNHMTEISMMACHEKSDMDNPPDILQNLACLIQEAWDAKDEAILANQKELLCWCSYIVEFNKKTTEFMTEYKIGKKKVKGMIYDNLIKLLRPGTKRNTLLKQTQRARDIYKLFEKIGIDKIKYITTYSANSISELSDSQIQTIVDYFSKNPNTELPDDRDGTIIDFEEDISNDQDNVLE
ncbi:hypothetical protein RclHR1_20600001, partial [Rhizophagus clarus]